MIMISDPSLILARIVSWFVIYWWLWLFIALLFIASQVWKAYIQQYFKKITNSWMMLEMRFPREITRSPRAMEQVFATVHAIKNSAADQEERWWDGEVPLWFSFEAVSFGGEVHFYLFIPAIRRNHIEAVLYANYPDIELTEVADDYIHRLPEDADKLLEAGYRIFGNELILSKNPVYPIRTYIDLEAPAEEKEVDPIASLIEALSRIKPQEYLWFQLLAVPKVDDYIDEFVHKGQMEIEYIKGKSRSTIDPKTGLTIFATPSPSETEAMKAIERKIAKPAFDAIVRYMYIAPRELFVQSVGRRSILAAMNQYATENFNKFKHNVFVWTLAKIWYAPFIFPLKRARARRIALYDRYRKRDMVPDSYMEAILQWRPFHWGFKPWFRSNVVLNTEELATLYHPPTLLVLTGPLLKRVEARRVGPPAGLPIYGEEGEELPGLKEDE
ncbi:MAG: hypothetical protein WAP52_02840 [Candidatus Sungiibacteriota bacterium]